ncbi:MAG: D-alanyl-D-alanine carboxypeptidase family protein, partial [Oscillospiraceae bacterium]|nr:D-alanyl-D-alanine carboxypeptidase family protein [Oscillospiraceae bacterium]
NGLKDVAFGTASYSYFFQNNGRATVSDFEIIGEKTYYFQTNGRAVKSDFCTVAEHRYYFDENGQMYHGWLELDGDTYYLKENGVMAIGQVTIDGVNRFFTSKGKHVLMPNPWNPVPEDYTCELVTVGSVKVSAECADALQKLVNAGKKAGCYMYVGNAYRSISLQQFIWDNRVQKYMQQGYSKAKAEELTALSVAIPGHSEHQLGLAADISKGYQSTLDWMDEHCWEYGFIIRYPYGKTEFTGIMHEPWHVRYVGVELAMELKELGLCMEEYMQMLTQQELEKEPPFTENQ